MRIECPECSQRFDVTEDFLGKTVECGSCDNRFKVEMDFVVREKKKFYPGEKRDSNLERFGRNAPDATEVNFQQAKYEQNVNPAQVGPPRPRRTVAMLCGIALMFFILVVFLLAGGKEGALRDMETINRFILCGFATLIGCGLVIYGTAHNRKVGFLIAAVSAAILMSMPILFPANPVEASETPLPSTTAGDDGADDIGMNANTAGEYLFEIGYDPVEEKIRKSPKDTVIAVFVRNATPPLRRTIGAYLFEETGKRSREITYDRGDDGMMGLIVLENQTMSLDEVAALCTKFGRIEKISRELRLIDVFVEDSKLTKLDQFKVLDSGSLDYESQNLKALNSIDPKVKLNAVKRLATSEPRARRDDITQQFIKMLPESSPELQLEIIRALRVWALPGAGAEKPVLEVVKELSKAGKVNKDAIGFLIQFKIEEGGPILLEQWERDPTTWYDTMISLDSGAQILILPRLKDLETTQVVAAAQVLSKVATPAAVPLIQEAMKGMDERSKKSLQAAIDEIKSRS